MKKDSHDDSLVTVELCGALFHVRCTPGALIDEASARTVTAQANELSSGKALPVLVEMAGVRGVTPEAGSVFATEWPSSKAALVGDSPVDEVIAAFYTARHKPAFPTRFFMSLTAAMEWLTKPDAADTPADRGTATTTKKTPRTDPVQRNPGAQALRILHKNLSLNAVATACVIYEATQGFVLYH